MPLLQYDICFNYCIVTVPLAVLALTIIILLDVGVIETVVDVETVGEPVLVFNAALVTILSVDTLYIAV